MTEKGKYAELTDEQLLAEFTVSGENRIVGILYERYGHLVLGLCMKYLKNKDEARDAVLEIFGKLLDDLKKYRISFFKSWLYVYSKNFCLMELRKRQSLLKKELEFHENTVHLVDFDDPQHLKEKERTVILLESAIETLEDGQKKCIVLFYLKNKSYIEIAGETGFSNNEVKSFIQNGKRNLKLRLEALMNEEQKGK